MSAQPVAIVSSGMVTSVGMNASTTAAAIRAGISNARETHFIDWGGEWIVGHSVQIDITPGRGKLVRIASMAIDECISRAEPLNLSRVSLVLCVAEEGRFGRPDGLNEVLISEIESELSVCFSDTSTVIAQGRVGGLIGLQHARSLIYAGKAEAVIVAGVDSYINWPTLSAFESRYRLLTSKHSNGFLPGEAAGAVLVTEVRSGAEAICAGIGFSTETSTIESGAPLKADGLVQAIRAAAVDAGCPPEQFNFRIGDLSGEQYYFKEAALAVARLTRHPQPETDLWHPADCIGEVGATAGPIVLAVAAAAYSKSYAPGPNVLCHFSNDCGQRAAAFLHGAVSR